MEEATGADRTDLARAEHAGGGSVVHVRVDHLGVVIGAPEQMRTSTVAREHERAGCAPARQQLPKIVVSGTKAKLYVNGAAQPALIVNDLKLGDSQGAIALWSHTSTDGYFTDLRVAQ